MSEQNRTYEQIEEITLHFGKGSGPEIRYSGVLIRRAAQAAPYIRRE